MLILNQIDFLIEQISNDDKIKTKKYVAGQIGKSATTGALAYGLAATHGINASDAPQFLANRMQDGQLSVSDAIVAKTHNIMQNAGVGDNIASQLGGEIGGKLASGSIAVASGVLVKSLIDKYYDRKHGTTTQHTTFGQKLKNVGKLTGSIAANTAKFAVIKHGLSSAGMDVSSAGGIAATTGLGLATSYGLNRLKHKFIKPKQQVAKTVASDATSALLQGKITKCPPGTRRNSNRQCVKII